MAAKITKSELKQMISEVLREELSSNKSSLTEAKPPMVLRFTNKNCPQEAYVILTDDGPFANDVFISYDSKGNYYTTVDYVDEINIYDCHTSVAEAEARAKDADSGTWGGWSAPMHIIKITNFRDAYLNGAEPEYTVEKTLNFANASNKTAKTNTNISTKTARQGYTGVISWGAYKKWSMPNIEVAADTEDEMLNKVLNHLDTIATEDKAYAGVSIFGKDGILVRVYGCAFNQLRGAKIDYSVNDKLAMAIAAALDA